MQKPSTEYPVEGCIFLTLDQLDDRHLRGVAAARANADDAGIPAVGAGVFDRDLIKQLFGNGFLGHKPIHLPLGVQRILPVSYTHLDVYKRQCYDFTPITNPTFGSALLAVRLLTSGVTGSHSVTGGVYKPRERIHHGMLIHDY